MTDFVAGAAADRPANSTPRQPRTTTRAWTVAIAVALAGAAVTAGAPPINPASPSPTTLARPTAARTAAAEPSGTLGDPGAHGAQGANAAAGAGATGQAKLNRTEVPGAGRQEAILTVERFGRYSVHAASRQGTSVQVVDRMAGELGSAGEAGRENGRLDLFLDRGEYKIVAESHPHGDGVATLGVEPFQAAPQAPGSSSWPRLVERKLVQEDLRDLHQVSYWLHLTARREVRLEAAGRNLADLRLWRDGTWLEEAEPTCAPIQPIVEQPLLRCEVATTLPAGLYLVTAYGGLSQPWSVDASEHPFYLRWGFPNLPDAGRRRYQVSPFGEDFFALPDNVNFVRIELPQAVPARLTAGWAPAGRLLSTLAESDAATAEVKKTSVPPVAQLTVPAKPTGAAATEQAPEGGAHDGGGARKGEEPSIGDEAGLAGGATATRRHGDSPGNAGDADRRQHGRRTSVGSAGAQGDGNGGQGDTGDADTAPNAGAGSADAGGASDSGSAGNDDTGSGGEDSAAGAAMPAGDGDAAFGAQDAAAGDDAAQSGDARGQSRGAAAEGAESSTDADAGASGSTSAAGDAATSGGDAVDRADQGGQQTGGEENGSPQAGSGGEEASGTPGDAAAPDGSDTADTNAAASADASHKSGPQLWVAVRGTPGQVYVLQHFEQKQRYEFRVGGRYWLSTLHTGDPRDSVDATGVLTSQPVDGDRERVEADTAVPIDGQHAWARRFNLLSRASVFLEIKETGRYDVVSSGGARFRIEPFATTRPANYKAPAFASADAHWDLDSGLYELTAEPLRRGGIVTLGIRPAGKFADLLKGTGGTAVAPDAVRGAARFAPAALAADHLYRLYVNRQPGVETGAVLRPWPVDLGQPLPVTQRPGEALTIEFTVDSPGTLRAMSEDGELLEASVDANRWLTESAIATAGQHQVQIRNPVDGPNARTLSYSLWVEPAELSAAASLPPLPASDLAALPRFTPLRPGAPQFLDLARGAGATFLVQVDKPALYQLQTTGVLATGAALRTRTVTSLAKERANGVGRNALVRGYLREGDYQATVTTVGASRGHLGVELSSTPLIDGGELRLEAPARITLPAGQGALYRFTIAEQGEYRLLAMGLGFVFAARLEDADGWPLAPPDLSADISRTFTPGSYRLVLLPQPMTSRAVTVLSRRQPALSFEGHGPHALPLSRAVEHLWREPDAGAGDPAPRPADVWRFDLPAAAKTTLTLDAEMQGTLTRLDPADGTRADAAAPDAALGEVPPGRSLTLPLPPGRYRLAVVCSRRNSFVRYHVRVATEELVEGQERLLQAPASLPVAVGGAGLVEISSFSTRDVRARLYGPDGALVADEDDRPDDWNFLISERLPAGRYRLEIEPVGRKTARLRVAMRTLAEVADKPLGLPFQGDLDLAGDVHLLPLTLPAHGDLLLVGASARENLGLGLEVREGAGWRLVGSATGREPRLELPLAGAPNSATSPTSAYRVRLWSLERRGTPVRFGAAAIVAPRLRESQVAKGVALPALKGLPAPLAPLAAAFVEADGGRGSEGAGLLRVHVGGATVRPDRVGDGTAGDGAWRGGSVAGQELIPLSGVGDDTLPMLSPAPAATGTATEGRAGIWLVAPAASGARVYASRVRLAPGLDAAAAAAFRLPGAAATVTCDLDRHGRTGPVVVLATALAGQPGVAVDDRDGRGDRGGAPALAAAGMAAAPRAAVAVALAPRQPVARVWDGESVAPAASPSPAAPTPPAAGPELHLSQLSFAAPADEPAAWGVTGGALAGVAARRFTLPAGAKRVRLTLGASQVAVLSNGDTPLSTHWQGGLPFEELLDSTADRLTVLHTREGSDPFTLELLPRAGGEGDLAVAPAAPYVGTFDRAGTLRLRLGGSAAEPVRRYRVWSGTAEGTAGAAAVLLDGAGGVRLAAASAAPPEPAGTAAAAAGAGRAALDGLDGVPGGYLLIQHGPGVVVAWTGDWQTPPAAAPQAVAPPASVALDGRLAHLAITSREGAVLHVRAATPALTLLRRAGANGDSVSVHPGGVRLDAYLLPGTTDLSLAALGDGRLGGFVELTTTPVLPTAEGLGPEVLLPAGDTRYFSFHVADRRRVGWGAAASAERVACRLLHADGQSVVPGDTGVQTAPAQMADLDVGDYLLALTSPADSAPVRVRPVVVGLTLPDTGPPPEVIRKYLQEAGAVVPAATPGSQP